MRLSSSAVESVVTTGETEGSSALPALPPIALLEDIFNGFPECPPPTSQSSPRPHLQQFASFLRDRKLRPDAAAALEALQADSSAAGNNNNTNFACRFFPAYGAQPPHRIRPSACRL